MLVEGNQMGRMEPSKTSRVMPTTEAQQEATKEGEEVVNNQQIVKK